MEPRRVAVLSRSFSAHPQLRSELLARCPDATFNDSGRTLAGDELVGFIDGHDAAVVALERLDAALLARLPGLRIIGKYGVGLDNVDLAACQRLDIRVGWTGGVNRRSVSELTLAFMIDALRHVVRSNREILGGQFRQIQGRQLSGRTVGVVGCGHVGKDVVRMLAPFGCRVLVNDLAPDAAFGPRNPALIQRVSRSMLTRGSEPGVRYVPGDLVEFPTPDGGRLAGVLKTIDAQGAVFDFNHPLAGQPVRFEVAILGIL